MLVLAATACGGNIYDVPEVPAPAGEPPICSLEVWGYIYGFGGERRDFLLYQSDVVGTWESGGSGGSYYGWHYHASATQKAEANQAFEEFRGRAGIFRLALNQLIGLNDDLGGVTLFEDGYYDVGYWYGDDCDPDEPKQYRIILIIPDKGLLVESPDSYQQGPLDFVTVLYQGDELATLEILSREMALGSGNNSFLTVSIDAVLVQAVFDASFISEDPQTAFQVVKGALEGVEIESPEVQTVTGVDQSVVETTEQLAQYEVSENLLATFGITNGDLDGPRYLPKVLDRAITLNSKACEGKSVVVVTGHHETYGEFEGSVQTSLRSFSSYRFFRGFSSVKLDIEENFSGFMTGVTFGEVYFSCDR